MWLIVLPDKSGTNKGMCEGRFDICGQKRHTSHTATVQNCVSATILACLWQCCCCRSPSQRQVRFEAACSCWYPRERVSKPSGWRSGWPGWTQCSPRSSPAPAASPCSDWAKIGAALLPGPWLSALHLCLQQNLHPAEVKAKSSSFLYGWSSLTLFLISLLTCSLTVMAIFSSEELR